MLKYQCYFFFQSAFAQLGLGVGKGLGSSSASNLASQISGNSIVSNNIGIGGGTFGGADAKSLATKIGNSLAANKGSNLASNIGNNGASNIGGLSSNFGKNIAGNSVVSNNIDINLGSNLGNINGLGGSLANGNVNSFGTNIANAGASVSGFANSGASNLAIGGANLAGSVASGFTANRVNNFAGGNIGGIGAGSISLGNLPFSGISNLKVGEIEYVNDVSANKGYTGELPIIGYVTFEGYIPAEGTVSVASDVCGCTN